MLLTSAHKSGALSLDNAPLEERERIEWFCAIRKISSNFCKQIEK
jgi:hypothetical protein